MDEAHGGILQRKNGLAGRWVRGVQRQRQRTRLGRTAAAEGCPLRKDGRDGGWQDTQVEHIVAITYLREAVVKILREEYGGERCVI